MVASRGRYFTQPEIRWAGTLLLFLAFRNKWSRGICAGTDLKSSSHYAVPDGKRDGHLRSRRLRRRLRIAWRAVSALRGLRPEIAPRAPETWSSRWSRRLSASVFMHYSVVHCKN